MELRQNRDQYNIIAEIISRNSEEMKRRTTKITDRRNANLVIAHGEEKVFLDLSGSLVGSEN